MNIRPQEITENGERSVRYKGSDGKMHDITAGNSGAGEPAASPATVQEPLVIDTRQGVSVTSDEVIAALNENRQVIYIIDDAKYTHYSRNVSIYDDGEPVVHVLTPGGTFKHSGTEIVIW